MSYSIMPGDLCKFTCGPHILSTARDAFLYKAQRKHIESMYHAFRAHENDLILIISIIIDYDYNNHDVFVFHKSGLAWTTTDKCIKIYDDYNV